MDTAEKIRSKALQLSPAERVKLIDELIRSLDQPDEHIDQKWQNEAEDRITAYKKGEIKTKSLQEVIEKYREK